MILIKSYSRHVGENYTITFSVVYAYCTWTLFPPQSIRDYLFCPPYDACIYVLDQVPGAHNGDF